MVDARMMRGDGWVRCSLCGALHVEPYGGLAVDRDGGLWDVCAGKCARDVGIVEREAAP